MCGKKNFIIRIVNDDYDDEFGPESAAGVANAKRGKKKSQWKLFSHIV